MSRKLNHFAEKRYVDKRSHQIGDVKYSVHHSDHGCWLKCDGRLLNQSEYPELFDLIGTSFGNGTEFRLPDCQGRVLGSSNSQFSKGTYAGKLTHNLTVEELPAHSHDGQTENAGSHFHNGTTEPSGGHSHTYYTGKNDGTLSHLDGQYPPGDGVNDIKNLMTSSVGDHTHNFTTSTNGVHNHSFITNSVGNNKEFGLMQPTVFIGNVFIFVKHE